MNMFAKIKKMNIEELADFLADRRCFHCAYFGNVCSGVFLMINPVKRESKGI